MSMLQQVSEAIAESGKLRAAVTGPVSNQQLELFSVRLQNWAHIGKRCRH